jgi:hypothetical protein
MRSIRPEVLNPVLALPAAAKLHTLPEPAKAALLEVLGEIRADAARRAAESWARHKAPMACYWKVISVLAGHIARAIKKGGATCSSM